MNQSLTERLLKWGESILHDVEIKSAKLDSILLIIQSVNKRFNFIDFFTNSKDIELSNEEIITYKELIKRRANYEPLAYISHEREFMGLSFYVDKNVLIPRCDTEILTEEAIKIISNNKFNSVLDLCTGSGCIIISLCRFCSSLQYLVASDINQKALDISKKNSHLNNVSDINFIKSNLFESIPNFLFDIIISNPPYIVHQEIKNLQPSVKNFEPITALDGGDDGLFFFDRIANNAKKFLKPDGFLLFEIGYDQGTLVSEILCKENYKNIIVKEDLAGLDRVISCQYNRS